MTTKTIKINSLNCIGYKSNCIYVNKLVQSSDCLYLCETWLTQAENHSLQCYKRDFHIISTPAQRGEQGRPYGGTVMLLRRNIYTDIDIVICKKTLLQQCKLKFVTSHSS